MKIILILFITLFSVAISIDPDYDKSIEEIVILNGYQISSYYVETSDGYILEVFRLSSPKVELDPAKQPVLLQHGLFDSSDAFLINYPNKSYSYTLVDQGFDVWLGNNRGNKYSLKNVNLSIYSSEFWDFSYVEMGLKDLPAMIDFILKTTNKQKINYYGHSQGTSQVFAGMSLNPEYFEQKLTGVIALGPVTNLANVKPCFLKLLADLRADKALGLLGIDDILPNINAVSELQSILCNKLHLICDDLLKLIVDSNTSDDDKDKLSVYLGHFPSGSSLKCVAHYAQSIRNKDFSLYSYGWVANLVKYGSLKPPAIDLSRIKNKVCLFVGEDDNLATIADNENLAKILTENGSLVKFTKLPDVGHLTFFITKNFWYNSVIMDCINTFNS